MICINKIIEIKNFNLLIGIIINKLLIDIFKNLKIK